MKNIPKEISLNEERDYRLKRAAAHRAEQERKRAVNEAGCIGVLVVERVDGGLRRFHERLRMGQTAVLRIELDPFARGG